MEPITSTLVRLGTNHYFFSRGERGRGGGGSSRFQKNIRTQQICCKTVLCPRRHCQQNGATRVFHDNIVRKFSRNAVFHDPIRAL